MQILSRGQRGLSLSSSSQRLFRPRRRPVKDGALHEYLSTHHFRRRSWGSILGPVAAPQLVQLWPAVTLFAVRSFTCRRVG